MVKHHKRVLLTFITVTILAALFSCGANSLAPEKEVEEEPVVIEITSAAPPMTEPAATEAPDPWSVSDLRAIARTLAGECYDDKEGDKRLVCEVILNRVSDGRWGSTILDVLECDGQFLGYWTQSRPISQSDLDIAEGALSDWYANGCEALSDYLYFCAGDNRENEFRTEY